jgi:hypothetical protein
VTVGVQGSACQKALHLALDRYPVSRFIEHTLGERQVRGDAVGHAYPQPAEHESDQPNRSAHPSHIASGSLTTHPPVLTMSK